MELRHLQTFAAVAEQSSFTRAAEALEVTQAAVSQHIAALEKELGLSLFQRGGRKVSLTAEGERLYGYSRKILDLVDEAAREVAGQTRAVRGTLRIASSTVPAEWLLPELLAEFRARHPNVHESVTVSDSTEAARAVEKGEADVGFIGERPHSSTLSAQPLASDELVLVAAKSHPLAKQKRVTLDHLRGQAIIVREPGSGSRHCVEEALETHGMSISEMTVAMEVNSNEAIRAAVERGVGVAFLSSLAVGDERVKHSLATISIRGFRAERQLYLVTDPHRIAPAPVRHFLDFVREQSNARV